MDARDSESNVHYSLDRDFEDFWEAANRRYSANF